MLDTGMICPSLSPWCNVVVLVREKDGSLCFCVDLHRLNAHTKKDSYPLLLIQEAFFHDGFQEQILASKNGTRVPAVHSFYCGKLGVL